MNILIATPLYPPDIGGPATYAKILEDELPKHDIRVTLLKFGDVRHLPKGIAHIAYLVKLFRALRGVDVLLALDPVSVGLPSALVALVRGKKFIVKIVGDYAWEQGQQRFDVTVNLDEFVKLPSNKFLAQVGFLRMIQKFVARRATRIIVPSNYLKGIVCAWGVQEEKISVIYNAYTSIDEIPPREVVRQSLHISGRILLSAGRLVPWKGFAMLIDVVSKLKSSFPDLKLFIAGGGPDEVMLRNLIIKKNLVDSVIMLGNIEHLTLMKYIRATDCFVLNTGYEGLSHQLLEVLAVGTPIVTTRVGGNVELIEDGVTGFLVRFNEEEELTLAIKNILNNRESRDEMTINGKKFVSQFTTNRMVDETLTYLTT